MEFLPSLFLISGVLAILLSLITLVLSQRKSTPDRSLRGWAVASAVVWVFTIMWLCGMIITLINSQWF